MVANWSAVQSADLHCRFAPSRHVWRRCILSRSHSNSKCSVKIFPWSLIIGFYTNDSTVGKWDILHNLLKAVVKQSNFALPKITLGPLPFCQWKFALKEIGIMLMKSFLSVNQLFAQMVQDVATSSKTVLPNSHALRYWQTSMIIWIVRSFTCNRIQQLLTKLPRHGRFK